jgi:hypothetical protein
MFANKLAASTTDWNDPLFIDNFLPATSIVISAKRLMSAIPLKRVFAGSLFRKI